MARLHPRCRPLLALAFVVSASAPLVARAHFELLSPDSWRTQDALGGPQKVGPCGEEGLAPTTGAVTTFAPGQTITIMLDETIFHPGHYRVALAVNDRSELPPEPPVTPGGTECGSAPIAAPPVFPVLVDGALQHTDQFSTTQEIQVTLPSDVTCTHCTLQVLEFMTNHAAPCFYHHCADISIQPLGNPCVSDADCADSNACTTDQCNQTTHACENIDTSAVACDDANVCTLDTCTAAQGCAHQPLTLAAAGSGFLGAYPVSGCTAERVPPAIGALFAKAGKLVTRAPGSPATAGKLLGRAARRLDTAAAKVAKAQQRRISPGCATALSTLLAQAQTRLQCLIAGL